MKRIPITIFVTALITGLILCIQTCINKPTRKPDKVVYYHAERQQTIVVIKKPSASYLQLKYQNDSLKNVLGKTKQKLRHAKARLADLKRTAAEQVTAAVNKEKQFNDSLKTQAYSFDLQMDSTRTAYQDSLCESRNLVAKKEAEIESCKCQYIQLQFATDSNLERQRALTDDIQRAYKQQRKELNTQKWLSGGLILLSTFTSALYQTSK